MPFQTSQNSGTAAAANALTRIFVGDPAADAEFRNNQIKNETEYARQKYLAEQAISETNRRALLDAQTATQGGMKANAYAGARANNGLAAGRELENKSRLELGKTFTDGMVNMNDPASASRVAGLMLQGGIDPKNAGAIALIPGQDDATMGRIFTAGGKTIGANDYVSTNDRNNNRTFSTNDRVVQGDGSVIAQGAPGAGGKVPMLNTAAANDLIRSALVSRGAQFEYSDANPSSFFQSQPQVFDDLSRLVADGWNASGGNAAAVQELLGQYLGSQSLADRGDAPFKPAADANAILAARSGQGQRVEIPQDARAPGFNPNVFTGGNAPLPNLQDVGNGGGWKVIGVQ